MNSRFRPRSGKGLEARRPMCEELSGAVLSMNPRSILRVTGLLLLGMGAGVAPVGATQVRGPQGVVRAFCQADAMGQRVEASTWGSVAPLVAWELEPAWDHVVLVGGYGVSAARREDTGEIVVDVRYSVIGQVSPLGLDTTVYVETLTFQVDAPDEGGWRIVGPPPPPHIFGTRVDVEEMRRSLEQGGLNFLPNTILVWQMLRAAGRNAMFEPTVDLLSGAAYQPIDSPEAGDLVVYLRDGMPYHVGLLDAENRIVSSTLNAGIVRTTVDAFTGEVTYLRWVEPEPQAADELLIAPPSDEVALAPSVRPARPAPTPAPQATKPRVRRRQSRAATPRPTARPPAAKPKRGSRASRRPAATPQP